MARIVPSDLSRLALAGAHRPELATLKQLRERLPDAYTVFHGVHWTRAYEKWTQFGEVDFVVVNRAGDVLLVEQKNGSLAETGDGLVKEYGDRSKSVAAQVHRSLDRVRDKFAFQHGRRQPLALGYLVYLPDHRVRRLSAAGLDAGRIVDAGAEDGLGGRIETLLGPGAAQPGDRRETVLGFFSQTLDLVPDIHAHIGHAEERFARQTGELADLLSNLDMRPWRLRVEGTAGCGKSLLAARFHADAARAGERPLLVCFNRPLADRFRETLGEGGHVSTYHGLLADFLTARGKPPEFGRMKDNPDFWREVQDRVVEETVPDDWRFDRLVVDEGQDFEREWRQILRLFVPDDAPELWLEDPDQELRGASAADASEFVTYRCRANHRSPESIARFIRATLGFEFESRNELPGLGVAVHGYDAPEEQPALAAARVTDLMRRGFTPEDIVLVSMRGTGRSALAGSETLAGQRLRCFTGEYDGPRQIMTPGRLRLESVYRFKGQEAPAVILTDVDPDPARIDDAGRLLFCGMTRATVRLEMLARRGNPENERFLEACAFPC